MKSVRRDVGVEVLKYIAIGAIGATLAIAYTWFERLPNRALTISPAGVEFYEALVPKCEETNFVSEAINTYLTNEISIPECNSLTKIRDLESFVNELRRAQVTWDIQRIKYLETTYRQLQELQSEHNQQSQSDALLRANVKRIVDELQYISRQFPSDIFAADQLEWSLKTVGTAVDSLQSERAKIKELITVFGGNAQERLTTHIDLFFVITNTSDIEYYFPMTCMLELYGSGFAGAQLRMHLQEIDREQVSEQAVIYTPLLPGRGKLVRFEVTDGLDRIDEIETAVAAGTLMARLVCKLPDKRVFSEVFELHQFVYHRDKKR